MDAIFNGIISGLVLACLIGPVFFSIIQTSIERGFSKGVLVALGVSLSDAIYIAIAYLGVSRLIDDSGLRVYLAYGGGMVLLVFGIYYLFVKSKKLVDFDPAQLKVRKPYMYIAKGFIINGLSPMVLIFWLGTVGVAATQFGYVDLPQAMLFFSTIVATVFLTDVIKAKLADKLRSVLTPRLIKILNIVLGIALVIFGGRLILFADQF